MLELGSPFLQALNGTASYAPTLGRRSTPLLPSGRQAAPSVRRTRRQPVDRMLAIELDLQKPSHTSLSML